MGFFYVFEGRFDNEIMILSEQDNHKIKGYDLGSQLILTKDEKKRGGGERFIKRKTKN